MARNLQCNCLCHGSDGNLIGDQFFSCKNCYAANHMGTHLPTKVHAPKPAAKRKPRSPKDVTVGFAKAAAKKIMSDLASAAQDIKDGKPVRS